MTIKGISDDIEARIRAAIAPAMCDNDKCAFAQKCQDPDDCDVHVTLVVRAELGGDVPDGTFKAGPCEMCGEGHAIEVRPYGPNGEMACFECAMKDEPAAKRAHKLALLLRGETKGNT